MEIQSGCVSVEANGPLTTERGAHERTSANGQNETTEIRRGKACTLVLFLGPDEQLRLVDLSPSSHPVQQTCI